MQAGEKGKAELYNFIPNDLTNEELLTQGVHKGVFIQNITGQHQFPYLCPPLQTTSPVGHSGFP